MLYPSKLLSIGLALLALMFFGIFQNVSIGFCAKVEAKPDSDPIQLENSNNVESNEVLDSNDLHHNGSPTKETNKLMLLLQASGILPRPMLKQTPPPQPGPHPPKPSPKPSPSPSEPTKRKLLEKKFSKKLSPLTQKSLEEYQAKQRKMVLEKIFTLPVDAKKKILQFAAKIHANITANVPTLSASDYLYYFETGQRGDWGEKNRRLRDNVAHLVVAQLLLCNGDDKDLENEGKGDDQGHQNHVRLRQNPTCSNNNTIYMQNIIDGLWHLLEQSTWVSPANIKALYSSQNKKLTLKQHAGPLTTYPLYRNQLPVPEWRVIDINVAEVIKHFAWIRVIFFDNLNAISPPLWQRIDYELRIRVFEPYLAKQWWWYNKDNNWNIWINGAVVKAALLTLDDVQLLNQIVHRSIESVDYLLDFYGDDGGCEEGASYWRENGGRMMDYLRTLCDIYGQDAEQYLQSIPMLRNVGRYPYYVWIDRNYYYNYGDARPAINFPPQCVAQFASLYRDELMGNFSAYIMHVADSGTDNFAYRYEYSLANQGVDEFVSFANEFRIFSRANRTVTMVQYNYLPNIQVFTARSKNDTKQLGTQWFVGAIGGNNGVSHNHLDVGSFILYQNGQPLLIELGQSTYNNESFNEDTRYKQFSLQSQYHNLPTINGVQQKSGANFKAKNVRFNATFDVIARFEADISGAYPKEAQVQCWNRTIELWHANNTVRLVESFVLGKFLKPQKLHFILPQWIVIEKTNVGLKLTSNATNDHKMINEKVQPITGVLMSVDWKLFEMEKEIKKLDDSELRDSWGDTVTRLTLSTVAKFTDSNSKFEFIFKPLNSSKNSIERSTTKGPEILVNTIKID